MATSGLLVRLHAKSGKDHDVENFLRSALPLVEEEPGTTAWFAVRFGRNDYGIFDAFADDAARQAHLEGPVATALQQVTGDLLDAPPRIEKIDVIAEKIPIATVEPDTKGLLLTFKAKPGHEPDVEKFLRHAQSLAMTEAGTTAWFAIRTEDGSYGIFDVFASNADRFAHLVGHVPRELAKEGLHHLGSVPEVELVNVQAEKIAT